MLFHKQNFKDIKFLFITSFFILGSVSCEKKSQDNLNSAINQSPYLRNLANVFLQQIQLVQGEAINLQYTFQNLQFNSKLKTKLNSGITASSTSGDLEIILLDPNGIEVMFNRDFNVNQLLESYIPNSSGSYTVIIRDNSGTATETPSPVVTNSNTGSTISGSDTVINTDQRTDSAFKDIVLKSFVSFSRTCKKLSDDGNTILSFTAPTNSYYIQPFVFLGKVDMTSKTVSSISTAQITITAGSTTLNLSKLSDIDYSIYRELGGLTQEDHLNYTKLFYQGYFGGAGELYTIDSFMYLHGDCANTPTFDLGLDPGLVQVHLNVTDSVNNLNHNFNIRPTVSTSYTTYLSENNPISDWTQCTYDLLTGNPMTYNGDASSCKIFSLLTAPFVKLDSVLPSQQSSTTTTEVSDPTRLVFYGHSYQKAFRTYVAENASTLATDANPSISLTGCLNNGGIAAVPLKSDNTAVIPLQDFNAKVGDVINLARRPGRYTGLTEFYQGDVNISGSVVIPTCIPSGQSSCDTYKNITVVTDKCIIRADSSIISTSISDSYVYPSYFEMSGIISE